MINSVTLVGRLTVYPEIKTTKNGKECCQFTIAINYGKKDEEKSVEYYVCTAWEALGTTISRYFKKGDYIAVSGRLSVKPYKTKHGDNATASNIVVNDFSFCANKSNQQASDNDKVSLPLDDDDELPF